MNWETVAAEIVKIGIQLLPLLELLKSPDLPTMSDAERDARIQAIKDWAEKANARDLQGLLQKYQPTKAT